MAQDYYTLLGIERTATPDEIKKAFRKLAMKHHPDRAEDKVAAEAKFKEINEAYAVLSDPEKRKQYDMFGDEGFHQRFSQDDIFRGANVGNIQDILGDMGFGGDLFSRIFGGAGGGRAGSRRGGRGVHFDAGPGFGFGGGGFHQGGGALRGQDTNAEIQISFDDAVLGGERQVSMTFSGGGSRTLNVKIPPGSQDGSKLRLKGQGAPSPSGGENGDLYLTLKVAPHPLFRRRGARDLEVDVKVNFLDLILGGGASVPTLRDGDKRIKIKAGTRPNMAVRLPGLGVAGSGSTGPGDLYAILQAELPEHLTDNQRSLFEQLRQSGL